MFRRWRLKKIHTKFLESCRTLNADREYWEREGCLKRLLLHTLIPTPVIGLHVGAQPILRALEWLELSCHQQRLDEDVIKQYHQLVFDQAGGEYRRGDVTMPNNPLSPPPGSKVEALMRQFATTLTTQQDRFDASPQAPFDEVLALGVQAYHRIGVIHPFSDGNGRVARLSMNHVLRRYNHGYVILPALSRSPQHWERLQNAGKGDFQGLIEFARSFLHPL